MKVLFKPNNELVECLDGESLFEAAKRIGVSIPTACNGKGSCGLCRIKILSGEENLSSQTKAEVHHLGNVYFITKVRLSCQCESVKDGIVEVEVK